MTRFGIDTGAGGIHTQCKCMTCTYYILTWCHVFSSDANREMATSAAKFKGKPVKGIAECMKVTTTEVSASSLHQNNLKLTLKLEDYRRLPGANKIKDFRQHFSDKDLVYFQVYCTPDNQNVQEFYKITTVRENVRAKFTSIQSSKAFLASTDVPSIFLPGSTPRHGLQSITDLTVLFKVGDRIAVDFAYLKDDRTLSYELRLPSLGKPPGLCLGIVCDTGLDYGYIWSHDLGYVHFQQPKDQSGKFVDGSRVRFYARERPEVNNCKFEVIEGSLSRHAFVLDFSGVVPPPPPPPSVCKPAPSPKMYPNAQSVIYSNGSGLILDGSTHHFSKPAPATFATAATVESNHHVNGTLPTRPPPGTLAAVVSASPGTGLTGTTRSPPPGITAGSVYDNFNLSSRGNSYKDLSWHLHQTLDRTPQQPVPPPASAALSNGFGAVGDGAPYKKLSVTSAGGAPPGPPMDFAGLSLASLEYGGGKIKGGQEQQAAMPADRRDATTQTDALKTEAILISLLQDDEILKIVSLRFPEVLRELLKK